MDRVGSRSEGKNLSDLKEEFKSDKISFLPLDLTSFDSVHHFVNQVKEIVPNNAISLLISRDKKNVSMEIILVS
jgi:hypothetical protein